MDLPTHPPLPAHAMSLEGQARTIVDNMSAALDEGIEPSEIIRKLAFNLITVCAHADHLRDLLRRLRG
jgi:hypothetical protein